MPQPLHLVNHVQAHLIQPLTSRPVVGPGVEGPAAAGVEEVDWTPQYVGEVGGAVVDQSATKQGPADVVNDAVGLGGAAAACQLRGNGGLGGVGVDRRGMRVVAGLMCRTGVGRRVI
jgi:hypothetical protein